MKKNEKKMWFCGIGLVAAFVIWTMLIQRIDVAPIGAGGTEVGFSKINGWFHACTGVHMPIYTITDYMGLIPVFICMIFGGMGFSQMCKRRSLFKTDRDLIALGIYYIVVILCYLWFEAFPVNYRPIYIEGRVEASYPSSTTLLVLSVMPTLWEQVCFRVKSKTVKRIVFAFTVGFSFFVVTGRLLCGVHWLTDIVGAAFLSMGLFCLYKASVLRCRNEKAEDDRNGIS